MTETASQAAPNAQERKKPTTSRGQLRTDEGHTGENRRVETAGSA